MVFPSLSREFPKLILVNSKSYDKALILYIPIFVFKYYVFIGIHTVYISKVPCEIIVVGRLCNLELSSVTTGMSWNSNPSSYVKDILELSIEIIAVFSDYSRNQ